nr:hypothetical protein [Spirochaetia bacterium]
MKNKYGEFEMVNGAIANDLKTENEHLTLEIFSKDNAIVRRDAEIKKLRDAIIRYTELVKEYDLDDDGELLLEMKTFIKNEIRMVNMKDKYMAFFAANCEIDTFETFEAAEKWLTDGYDNDSDEGYSEETMNGFDYIAKITHRSKFTETDKKE